MPSDAKITFCQQEIIKLDLEINAVIQDIRKCEGSVDDLHSLNHDVHRLMQKYKEHIQELEKVGKEHDVETDKVALLKEVDNHRKQLANTQVSLRKANLTSTLAIEAREKQSLLSGSKQLSKGRSDKESMATTTSEVTDSLMALRRSMSDQVKASEASLSTLVQSSGQIINTQDEFKSMSGHIQISNTLLKRYSRREFTDKLLIFLALVFFFAVVLYIVKKRAFSASSILGAAHDYTGETNQNHQHTEM